MCNLWISNKYVQHQTKIIFHPHFRSWNVNIYWGFHWSHCKKKKKSLLKSTKEQPIIIWHYYTSNLSFLHSSDSFIKSIWIIYKILLVSPFYLTPQHLTAIDTSVRGDDSTYFINFRPLSFPSLVFSPLFSHFLIFIFLLSSFYNFHF